MQRSLDSEKEGCSNRWTKGQGRRRGVRRKGKGARERVKAQEGSVTLVLETRPIK